MALTFNDIAADKVEDMIEHLFEERGIRQIIDLTREERNTLGFWVLIQHKMYKKLIMHMQQSINDCVAKYEKRKIK